MLFLILFGLWTIGTVKMPDPWTPEVDPNAVDIVPAISMEYMQRKFRWMTRGENCVLCEFMRGRVYTMDTFMATGFFPGFHLHCNCYLTPVDDDVPVSNLDIFGDSLNLMANDKRWFFGLFNYDPDFKPYNAWITDLINQEAAKGGTLREIMKRLKRNIKTGSFILDFMQGSNFNWNVYRTVLHSQGVDGTWFGGILDNIGPVPEGLIPDMPYQTYVPGQIDFRKLNQ